MHILVIFLDGIGLGDNDPLTNPFAASDYPTLHRLSNGHRWLNSTALQRSERTVFIPTDPRMGVSGRPQSGSGQAAILTGRNIPQIVGEHYGPKPNQAIRALLDEDNFFIQVVNCGKTASLIEAYPPQWHQGINNGKSLPSSYQYAARAANLPFMGVNELRAGTAISGDWTGERWRSQLGYDDIPTLTPYAAGIQLVEISRRYDFAFSAHWLTDIVGHRGSMEDAVKLLNTFDGVMQAVLDTWQDDEGIVIITSDHGNMEEIGNRKHTENDVPTIVIGSEKEHFAAEINDLAGIVPVMKRLLL